MWHSPRGPKNIRHARCEGGPVLIRTALPGPSAGRPHRARRAGRARGRSPSVPSRGGAAAATRPPAAGAPRRWAAAAVPPRGAAWVVARARAARRARARARGRPRARRRTLRAWLRLGGGARSVGGPRPRRALAVARPPPSPPPPPPTPAPARVRAFWDLPPHKPRSWGMVPNPNPSPRDGAKLEPSRADPRGPSRATPGGGGVGRRRRHPRGPRDRAKGSTSKP